MSRKVFTCFIVISLFLNKAASYGQEIQVSRDTVKVSVQEGNTSPHNERSITPKPLDIRKAVDLSSGSCPSRITFDVQNPYNPTFPTDKSPLHEGEYSTSGIINSCAATVPLISLSEIVIISGIAAVKESLKTFARNVAYRTIRITGVIIDVNNIPLSLKNSFLFLSINANTVLISVHLQASFL